MLSNAARANAAHPAKDNSHRTRVAGIAIATAAVVSTIFVALDRGGGGSTPFRSCRASLDWRI